jgi:hypothetical protein
MVLQLSSYSAAEILDTCTASSASTNSSARAIVPAPTLVIKARKSASHSPARSAQFDVATPPAIIGDVQLELINSPAFSSVSKSWKSQYSRVRTASLIASVNQLFSTRTSSPQLASMATISPFVNLSSIKSKVSHASKISKDAADSCMT